MNSALIIVDVQNDFMPGGTLAVAEGDNVATPINTVRDQFDSGVFTRDWHPANHCSFVENGGLWPAHCVQNTPGAAIDHRILRTGDKVIPKGIHVDVDSYSGFWDNERRSATELNDYLQSRSIGTVFVCGLATDYCVLNTALDAVREGYMVRCITDACRGVNLHPGDSEKAFAKMERVGVSLVTTREIVLHPAHL
jgi:nicotinamidase/pyrazinamidase